MAYGKFNIGRVVKAAAAAVIAIAMAFHWQSPTVSRAAEPAGGTGEVWGAAILAYGGPDNLGKDAGQKLKEICKGRKPDLVLFFDGEYGGTLKTAEHRKAVLDSLAEHFDKKSIFGQMCHGVTGNPGKDTSSHWSSASPVLALGGVKATPAKVAVEKGKEEEAYATLAESLKAPYAEAAGKGRLVLIFGSCIPTNGEKIVNAFTKTLGKDVCLFGSTRPEEGFQYYQGEVMKGYLAVILITGNFTCDFAMADASPSKRGSMAQDPDKIVESATKAMKAAVGDNKDNAALIFVANSWSRDHSQAGAEKKTKPTASQDEDKAIRNGITVPLCIFMSDLEIGHPATGEPTAVKFDQINVCAISPKKK